VALLQDLNANKATNSEVESLRKLVDRVAFEMENKPGFNELDTHAKH
jgi:hypothetical protein